MTSSDDTHGTPSMPAPMDRLDSPTRTRARQLFRRPQPVLTRMGYHRVGGSGLTECRIQAGSPSLPGQGGVLDEVVIVVQEQLAQIVNLLLAKVSGAEGDVGCS